MGQRAILGKSRLCKMIKGEMIRTGYLRSLAMLAVAPILSVKNSSDALADRHGSPIDVPITGLIVTSRRRIRNNTKNKLK